MLYKNTLIRVDLNTSDSMDTKFQTIAETVRFFLRLSERVILITHYKQPKVFSLEDSVQFLCPILEKQFHTPVNFLPNIQRPDEGKLCLLENIRFFKGEIENDDNFAKELATLGDFYVNEAFSSSHRKHASIDRLPHHLPHTLGFSHEKEKHMLKLILSKVEKPILVIMGGIKFETKKDIMLKLQKECDYLFLGDGMSSSARPNDINSERLRQLKELIVKSKTIIWNGALGKIEQPPYDQGTQIINQYLKTFAKEKTIIIGGGSLMNFLKPNYATYTTTGGGALLNFVADCLSK